MADALVSFMLEKLATVTQQEVSLVVGAEKEVENLKTTFKFIQAVLNDAEQRQIKDEAVKLWLEEFKDIAYDMDDVLDEWSYQMMHKSQNDTNKKKVTSSYLCSLCSCFSKVAVRHNIGTQIIKIKERLDKAEMDKNKFGLVQITRDDNPIERLKTSSIVDVTNILGRVSDKKTIMTKLMDLGESSTSTTQPESSSTQVPNIISIVGMGGLGKTTLAQLVFNDDQVKTHFEKTMWVCVSDPFDLVTVTKAIIEEAKCEVPRSSEWNTLHHSLSESIKGKRFLLVLDDVWTYDRKKWELFEVSFKLGAKGSRILVTTRNEGVALMMNATYTHSLEVLSDDDCSSLLNRIALAGEDNMKTHEGLREIGDKISKKCKGLPLAAKTLGGLLHSNKNKNYWKSILRSEIWKLEREEVENDFLKPALLLSYYNLPLPLKGCFVYCSIFPKDHVIEKDLLVKLWMAQGFLNKSGSEDLEVNGEDYFNNLVKRSFFQDFTKDDDGDIISCKMHDLVHDLAQYLTKNECFVKEAHNSYDDEKELNRCRVRHLTLTASYDGFPSSLWNAEKLRTLQILNGRRSGIREAPADLFRPFTCLKVLCLNDIGLENLSGEIGNLIHLRYLDLSDNFKLKILPETISNLYNLQTLKLEECGSLCKLPREMRRMINLRHLDLRDTYALSYIPQGIGGLTSLRTLSKFIVGGASEGCKISELKNLKLLQGELRIRGLGRVETVNEALEMEMKKKPLHTLRLGFKHKYDEVRESGVMDQDVLDVLEPHPDVVELRVDDYLGLKLSSWIGSTSILSHVKTLVLSDCINLTKFPAFGQLPSLEVLEIQGAKKVKHIGCEFLYEVNEEEEEEAAAGGEVLRFNNNTTAFPKLKTLIIEGSEEMEWELEEGVNIAFPILPCLRELHIWGGLRNSKSFIEILSKISSLETLFIGGEATELVKYIRGHDDDLYIRGHDDEIILFPNLKTLVLGRMKDMEELKIGFQLVMPLLSSLKIIHFKKLKAIQGGESLESLVLIGCSSLYQLGIPNLKSLEIRKDPIHPEAFATTTLQATLEELTINCGVNTLTCMPEQVQQLTSLKSLVLHNCGDELVQRCRKDQGEDWRIISHIPTILINNRLIN